jgi:glycoside/pentoside/hexuronide:cation symporter, GPH family
LIASSSPLSLGRRLGYGIGDSAFNLYFTTANLYLLLFYTDVLELSPATAGWIFAAALIWDAAIDPLMGYLASRTRTRWGRYRPYILFGAIPLAASWVLIFVPTGLTGMALTLAALAAHMLFRTLYTVVSMPYLSLSSVMTRDSNERGILAAFRMVAATASGLIIAFFTLKLVDIFGGGDQAQGFLWTAILFASVATMLFWITFATTREAALDVAEHLPDLGAMWTMMRSNTPFWLVSGSLLMGSMASTFFGKSIPYYFKYTVGRADLIGLALASLTGAAMLSIPIWTILMRRTSKRTVALCGTLIAMLGYALFQILPPTRPDLIIGNLALLGVAAGANYLTFWAMVPDTVEYGQWRTRVRADGMVFGLVSFNQKAALGLAVGALGESLSLIGYTANRAQTPETLASLKLLMGVAPLVFAAAGAAFMFFYPIDRALHGRLTRAVAWRSSRNA